MFSEFGLIDLVLPYPYDSPSEVLELYRVFVVPFNVAPEFCQPVVRVSFWCRGMFVATVPEAPIDEQCHLGGRKYDIDFHTPLFKPDVAIFSEAQTRPVKHASEGYLGFGVRTTVRHHRTARGLVGGGR